MFYVFFMTDGPILIHQVPREQSINGRYYRTNCLEPFVEQIKTKRAASGTHAIKLHSENAPPHKTLTVNDYLAERSITVMSHPAYCPFLAPCDFWLFGFLKRQLGSYSDEKSLKQAVTKTLQNLLENLSRKTFKNLIERMKLCIKYHGDYFEHLMQ